MRDIYGKKVTFKVSPVLFYMYEGKILMCHLSRRIYPVWPPFYDRVKTNMRSLPVNRIGQIADNLLWNQHRFLKMRKFCTQFKSIVVPQTNSFGFVTILFIATGADLQSAPHNRVSVISYSICTNSKSICGMNVESNKI